MAKIPKVRYVRARVVIPSPWRVSAGNGVQCFIRPEDMILRAEKLAEDHPRVVFCYCGVGRVQVFASMEQALDWAIAIEASLRNLQ